MDELENAFQGKKYIFTLSSDGKTIVTEFEDPDETYNQVVRNVATGTGVILVCVTVSVLTGGTAPAVSMIFAVSAKTGTTIALSSGVISGVAAGITTQLETGDPSKAVEAAALKGSNGFKWGAITGAISGGAGEAVALHGATMNGLTMNEAAIIQKESGYPLSLIKNFKSIDEYNYYKNAGLTTTKVGKELALTQDIDWNRVDPATGKTNLELALSGNAPKDPTGTAYELHHIGQKDDSALAILTEEQHRLNGNFCSIHTCGVKIESEIDRAAFKTTKKEFWKALGRLVKASMEA